MKLSEIQKGNLMPDPAPNQTTPAPSPPQNPAPQTPSPTAPAQVPAPQAVPSPAPVASPTPQAPPVATVIPPQNPAPQTSSIPAAPSPQAQNPTPQTPPLSSVSPQASAQPASVSPASPSGKKSPILIVSLVFLILVVLVGAYYSLLALGGMQSGYMTSEPSLVNYFTTILISNVIFAILWIVTIVGLWLQKKWGQIMFLVTLGLKLLFTILLAVMFLGQNVINGNDLAVAALLRAGFVLVVGGALATMLLLNSKKS